MATSLHDVEVTTPDILLKWMRKACCAKKGKLIIPAFSVGRTQELLFALNQLEAGRHRLPDLDYFVDSPLSIEANGAGKTISAYFNKTIQKILETDNDPFRFQRTEIYKNGGRIEIAQLPQ